jgi:hypothetical protein
VTRNFPVVGHFRYFFEEMGQPLRQYFFAGDLEEKPYNRVTRSWVYASAKGQNNLIGFGSQVDHNEPGRMHIVPSMYPTLKHVDATDADLPRPRFVGARRAQPYQPRRFANISGMSYGALSPNAVRRAAPTFSIRLGPRSSAVAPLMAISMTTRPARSLRCPQVKMVEIKLAHRRVRRRTIAA